MYVDGGLENKFARVQRGQLEKRLEPRKREGGKESRE